jgi:cephalosporin-C deacetylase-like acetyl esterase
MTKAAKKEPARKRPAKAAVSGAIVDKRAKASHDMEPHLRDCQRWTELADDRSRYDMIVRHLAEKMEKLVAAYNEMGGYEP